MSPRKKTVTIDIPIYQHSIYFAVQKAFQDAGVHLVDLESNVILRGQINVTDLGLIRADRVKPKFRRPLGFVSKPEPVSRLEIEAVEATLTILQNPERPPVPILVCVVDDNQVSDWISIVAQIAGQFVVTKKGKRAFQAATFEIESLCVPDPKNPRSALDAMLDRIHRRRSGSASAVSDLEIPSSDLDFDEDDEV